MNTLNSKITNEDYEKLISGSMELEKLKEKSIVNGKIVGLENDIVIVDVGLKSEGRIPISEFTRPGQAPEISVGDNTEVYIENFDNSNGETRLSREKAVKQNAWNKLQECFNNNSVVTGVPFNRVKGGLSVDLDGVLAFLPGSQIDPRSITKDTKELLNKPLDLLILKMDKFRGNIVVSRKAISEAELKEQKKELLNSISEGSDIEGKVKNITDYGAFIDLGGMDGLVHVTDISWTKINSPNEVLQIGQKIKVIVLKYDEELSRLSLGIKQLSENPWLSVKEEIEIEKKVSGKVISINDNFVNVIINNKYDGLINLNELTWLKKPPHPNKIVNLDQEFDIKVLEIDDDKKRIICSLKQLKENPWNKLNDNFKINDTFETEIVNIVDFGIFVKIHDEIDGMIHVSDLSWDENECPKMLQNFKKGEKIKVKILDINIEKERISLGIKQLESDPIQEFLKKHPLKSKVSGKILEVDEKGLKLDLGNEIHGYIKKTNLSKDKSEQKPDRFASGEAIDSMIVSVDSKNRQINLSIKDIEIQDEKDALSKYGSSDSGASLGDILGEALVKKEDKNN